MVRVVGGVAALWVGFAMVVAGGAGQALEALGVEIGSAASPQGFATMPTGSPLDTADISTLALDGTLRISGRTCDGQMLGSGFVLDGQTVTNRHLIEGATEFKVDNPSARTASVPPTLVTVFRRAAELDLASGTQVGSEVFTAAEENPQIGDLVYVAGHAGGGETLVLAGHVHLFDVGSPWGYGGDVMLLDVSTTGGFSGGPVLDSDGRVVGMLQGYSPTLDLSIAIPIESLGEWLDGSGSASKVDCS